MVQYIEYNPVSTQLQSHNTDSNMAIYLNRQQQVSTTDVTTIDALTLRQSTQTLLCTGTATITLAVH